MRKITRHLKLSGGIYHLKYKRGNITLHSCALPNWNRVLETINWLDREYEGLM